MRSFVGTQHKRLGEAFNDLVADIFAQTPGYKVRRRVKKIGDQTLGNLGDIDVLVADEKRRRVLVVECKDLSLSRTPAELANEVADLLVGQKGQKSMVAKHQARIAWVRQHLPEVLTLLRVGVGKKWKCDSFMVVDQPLMAPLLHDCPVKVITVEQLRQDFLSL